MFLQLFVNGLVVGCTYGLVAPGFVSSTRPEKSWNFAQGELVSAWRSSCSTLVVQFGLNYWLGLALAIVAMATFGGLSIRSWCAGSIGYVPTVMLTIGLGS